MRVRNKTAAILSVACAASVPPFLLFLWEALFQRTNRLPSLSWVSLLLVAYLYVLLRIIPALVIEVPAVVALIKLRVARWWSICAAAFASGFICASLITYFLTFDSADPATHTWDDGVVVAQFGVPTHAGWLLLFRHSSYDGILCAVVALFGWICWAILSRSSNRFERRL